MAVITPILTINSFVLNYNLPVSRGRWAAGGSPAESVPGTFCCARLRSAAANEWLYWLAVVPAFASGAGRGFGLATGELAVVVGAAGRLPLVEVGGSLLGLVGTPVTTSYTQKLLITYYSVSEQSILLCSKKFNTTEEIFCGTKCSYSESNIHLRKSDPASLRGLKKN